MTEYRYIGKDGKPVLARDLEDQRDELQDKLTKAVSALRWVVTAKGLTDPTEYGYGAIKHARVVLEEIKGET
jgi:hypothetical protein